MPLVKPYYPFDDHPLSQWNNRSLGASTSKVHMQLQHGLLK